MRCAGICPDSRHQSPGLRVRMCAHNPPCRPHAPCCSPVPCSLALMFLPCTKLPSWHVRLASAPTCERSSPRCTPQCTLLRNTRCHEQRSHARFGHFLISGLGCIDGSSCWAQRLNISQWSELRAVREVMIEWRAWKGLRVQSVAGLPNWPSCSVAVPVWLPCAQRPHQFLPLLCRLQA